MVILLWSVVFVLVLPWLCAYYLQLNYFVFIKLNNLIFYLLSFLSTHHKFICKYCKKSQTPSNILISAYLSISHLYHHYWDSFSSLLCWIPFFLDPIPSSLFFFFSSVSEVVLQFPRKWCRMPKLFHILYIWNTLILSTYLIDTVARYWIHRK